MQAEGQLAGEQGALLISGRAGAVAAVRRHAQHDRAARGGGRLQAHPSARPPNAARLRCRNPGHTKIQSPYERAESADRDGTFDLPKAETSPRRLGDLAQPRTGRTTIVITVSNQQGYASDTCVQGRTQGRPRASQPQPGPFRWADPAVNRQCHQPPPGRGPIQAPGRTGSARRPCAYRRAWRCTRAAPACATAQHRPCPDDELAGARTGTVPRAVSSGLRRAGRLRAPAPISSVSTGAIPATTGQDQPRLTARISGKSQPWNCRSSTLHTSGGASAGQLAQDGKESILPAQRPGAPLRGLESTGPAGREKPRFERVCGIWCGHRCCTLRLYSSPYWGSRFRIMFLTCGARGTRTPGPLLANRRQAVHLRLSPQLTVLRRASGSLQIRVRCCTFRLYSPAGSAAAQERYGTSCRASGLPTSAARRDRRPEVACHGFDLTLLPN